MKPNTQTDDLKTSLLGPDAAQRYRTVSKVLALQKSDAIPLLRDGLSHWDRRLALRCATALVKVNGESVAQDLAGAHAAGHISTKAAIDLIAHCDGPHAFEFASQYLHANRKDWRAAALQAIARFHCKEAVLYRWVSRGSSLTSKTEAELTPVPDAAIRSAVRHLGLENRVQLLDSPRTRQYMTSRGLESLYADVDSPQGVLIRLLNRAVLSKRDKDILSAASQTQVRQLLRKLSCDAMEVLAKKKAFRDLVLRHGLLGDAPALLKLERRRTRQRETERLARLLKLEKRLIGRLCADWNSLDDRYRTTTIPKRDGSRRTIAAPDYLLKIVQRSIYEHILAKKRLHAACHGFRRGRSSATNARFHARKKVVINIDLKDFFPSISAGRVYGTFRQLGFAQDPARLLTRLTTHEGKLPQGAPTSPALANLVARRMDSRLAGLIRKVRGAYTRYADDLTFSGGITVIPLLPFIRMIIQHEGFEIAEKKFRIARRGARQEVTGLTVNDRVAVPRTVRRRIRSVLHHLSIGKPATWNGVPVNAGVLSGIAAYVRPFDAELAKACTNAAAQL